MRLRFWFLAVLVLLGSAAHAQLVQVYPDIDRLAAEPGAQVTRNKDGRVESVTLERAGVVISSTRQGDTTQITGEDKSGHGAVLCNWAIYIEVRNSLDICFQDKYPRLHEELDSAIGSINSFIAANSLVPMSEEAGVSAVAARDAAVRADAANTASGRPPRPCSPDIGQMAAAMAHVSHDDFQKAVTNLLSVPRPPVMSPCL